MTRQEILRALGNPETWHLAIVEVDGEHARTPTYLRRPFKMKPEDAATSVNYSIRELLAQGERVEVGA